MANTWSKEDRFHYNKSEVWQELEKRVIDTVNRVEILQDKIAQDVAGRTQAQTALTEAVKDTNEALKENKELMGSAEDGEVDDDDSLKDEVIDDLRTLAASAIAEGNIKLAYKIERTIDEILAQDVACE